MISVCSTEIEEPFQLINMFFQMAFLGRGQFRLPSYMRACPKRRHTLGHGGRFHLNNHIESMLQAQPPTNTPTAGAKGPMSTIPFQLGFSLCVEGTYCCFLSETREPFFFQHFTCQSTCCGLTAHENNNTTTEKTEEEKTREGSTTPPKGHPKLGFLP